MWTEARPNSKGVQELRDGAFGMRFHQTCRTASSSALLHTRRDGTIPMKCASSWAREPNSPGSSKVEAKWCADWMLWMVI